MSTKNTKPSNKNASNFEKEEEISEESVRKYRGRKRTIPAHIVDDMSLTETQKSLYALLDDLSHDVDHMGYCFASNAFLGKIMNMKTRTLQRNLEKLHKKDLLIIEISQKFTHVSIRKIWTLDQFGIRERLEKMYEKDKFNQRFYTHVKNDASSCHICHTYVATEDISIREVVSPNIGCTKPIEIPKKKENITPSATTAFSQKKIKAKERKKQIPFEERQKEAVRKKWGAEIANPVIRRIEDMMQREEKSYTSTSPYEDCERFCAEASKKKSNRFCKRVPENTQAQIEEKNLDAINNIISYYNPSEDIFSCSTDTKTVGVVYYGKKTFEALDYTKEDFREKMYRWHEPYRLEKEKARIQKNR